jgi:hypothetical protein
MGQENSVYTVTKETTNKIQITIKSSMLIDFKTPFVDFIDAWNQEQQ